MSNRRGDTMKITVESKSFASAVKRVGQFVSKDNTRSVLQCVYLERTGTGLRLIGADGFTLGLMDVAGDWDMDGMVKAILPLKDLVDWLKNKKGRLALEFSAPIEDKYYPNYVADVSGMKCQSGFFPDYTMIIPKADQSPTGAICQAAEFSRAVRVVSACMFEDVGTRGKRKPNKYGYIPACSMARVTMNGCLKLETRGDLGEFSGEVEYVKQGIDNQVFLSVNFLSRVAGKSGGLCLWVKGPSEPVLFLNEGLTSVVMPMDGKKWTEGV
jgi:hypothetical protein